MGKRIVNHVQEAPSPRQAKSKEEHTEHTIVLKLLTKITDKDKVLKATREKNDK